MHQRNNVTQPTINLPYCKLVSIYSNSKDFVQKLHEFENKIVLVFFSP